MKIISEMYLCQEILERNILQKVIRLQIKLLRQNIDILKNCKN